MGATSIQLDEQSLRFTILGLENARVSMRVAGVAAIEAAGLIYADAVKRNLSLTDHTLRQLADLGHPYAARHGSIQVHQGTTADIRDATSQVHRQSGRLLRGLRKRLLGTGSRGSQLTTKSNAANYRVWVDGARVPYWKHITGGTARMLPRDPLWETASAPGVRTEMRRAIIRALGKGLNAGATIRFGP